MIKVTYRYLASYTFKAFSGELGYGRTILTIHNKKIDSYEAVLEAEGLINSGQFAQVALTNLVLLKVIRKLNLRRSV